MRRVEEYREILDLWEMGESKKSIARMTGIPRRYVCISRQADVARLDQLLGLKR